MDQWRYWASALEGVFIEELIQRGKPQSGFYRDRSARAVAIWRDDAGELFCSVTSGYAPKHADEIDELFGFVCRAPITRDLYMHIAAGGAFPEDVEQVPPSIGDNSANLPPHEAIGAEIEFLIASARDWLASIGGKIASAEHADKASNYATKFGELEKKADAARAEEKKPFDDGAKDVQARWRPIVSLADEKKRWMKKETEAFLIAEKRRREEEARKAAAEAAKQAEVMGDPPPPQAPVRVNAGTRGKVALKTRVDFVVSDYRTFAESLLALEHPPHDLLEALDKIARRLGAAGANPPGVERREIEFAA